MRRTPHSRASGTTAADDLKVNTARALGRGPSTSLPVATRLQALESVMSARQFWSDTLGQTMGGDRDLYVECGYKKNPTFEDYKNRFTRQDIASTLISAYPDATWRAEPDVLENQEGKLTKWEEAWRDMAEESRLWHYIHRTDVLAGVGEYAVLFLGLDDGNEPVQEVKRATKLTYLQPFYRDKAEIATWVTDTKDPRYNMPLTYRLTPNGQGVGNPGRVFEAHWSRIVHVAEGCLDSDVFGTPRLQRVLQRLEDIDKIAGASAEGYWKSAFRGAAFIKQPDADWGDNETEMEDEVSDYYNHLTRFMRLSGVDIKDMPASVSSPKDVWELQLTLLAVASRIPRRILEGSERGELSSTQDEEAWLSRVDERRRKWAGPSVVRPLVRRLMKLGVVKPLEKFEVEWPDVQQLSDKDKASVAATKAQALSSYASGMQAGADMIVPPYYFLVDFLGVDEQRAEEYASSVDKRLKEEADEAERAQAMQEEEQAAALAAGMDAGGVEDDSAGPTGGGQPPAPPPPPTRNPLAHEFDESEHPRAEDGKFTSGGGGKAAKIEGPQTPFVSAPPEKGSAAGETQGARVWMGMVAKFSEGNRRSADWKYVSAESLILAQGQNFKPGPRPADVEQGEMKLCFMNAYQLADRSPNKYTYVEGFATSKALGEMALHHAWCVDKKTGMVVDPTWKDGTEYVGVPLKMDFVRDTITQKGTYGVISRHERKVNFIRDGIPTEAVESIPAAKGAESLTEVRRQRDSAFNGQPANMQGKDTYDKYRRPDGTWTPERAALHDQIVSSFFKGKTPVEKPTSYLLGGGPGAGKTTLLKSGLVNVPENYVLAGGDDIKQMLPEYKAVVGRDPDVAVYAHEESSYLSKRIAVEAASKGYNLVMDGTGDSGIRGLTEKVNSMRRAGQPVVGIYVTIPTEVALERAAVRMKETGRGVPESVIRANHRGVSAVFEQIVATGLMDKMLLYDTTSRKPKLLVSVERDRLTVHDAVGYKQFLNKAKEV